MSNKIQVKRSAVAAKVPVTGDLDLGEIAINTFDGKMYIKKDDGTQSIVQIGAASGDVVGPASATDNAVARYDGTTGKLIQNSVVTASDTGEIAGVSSLGTPNYIDFNTSPTVTNAIGRLYWDNTQQTLSVGLTAAIAADIGQTLYAYATNAEATTITKGQPVYMFGAQGDRVSVKLASNVGDSTSAKTLGVCAENIAAGAAGLILCQGVQDGLNLSAYAPGDTLYLGATAGTVTNVKPFAPNHLVYIGVVERANAGNGRLYVRIQNGFELDEIHDVSAQNPTNGQTLVYNSSNSLWESSDTFTSPKVITADTTTDALRITQIGTGNALVVEDSTNPDATPFVVDASGNVGIGNATPTVPLDIATTNSGIINTRYASFAISPATVDLRRSASATVGTNTLVTNGNEIGRISFSGADGSTYRVAASISANVDGVSGASDMPGRLTFNTTADGDSAVTERMRIDNAGRVGIGTSSLQTGTMLTVGGISSLGRDGANGYIQAVGGGTTNTGYLGFFTSADVRQAYIGYIGAPNDALNIETDSGSNKPVRIATNAATRITVAATGATTFDSQILLNQDYIEKRFTANSGTAITLNLANGTMQDITLTGNTTITMPTAVAGKSFILFLRSGTGGFTVAWSTVKWSGGQAPIVTATASRLDIYSFFSDGTNWYGITVNQNYTP